MRLCKGSLQRSIQGGRYWVIFVKYNLRVFKHDSCTHPPQGVTLAFSSARTAFLSVSRFCPVLFSHFLQFCQCVTFSTSLPVTTLLNIIRKHSPL